MGSNEHNYVHWGTISVASFLTDRWALSLSLRIADLTGRQRLSPGWGQRSREGARGEGWERADRWGALSGQQQSLSHFGLNSPVLIFIRGFPSPAPPLLSLPPGTQVCDACKLPPAKELAWTSAVCYTGKLGDGTQAEWVWAETKPRNGTLARKHQWLLLVSYLQAGSSGEKDLAPPGIRAASSAHLFWLSSEFTQPGTAWQDVFATKPECSTSCTQNPRVQKMVVIFKI